jgi:hypothetical protein
VTRNLGQATLLLLSLAAACLGDPVGPGSLAVSTMGGALDTVWVGAPGENVPGGIRLRVTDDAGRPLPGAALTWEVIGRNAQLLAATAQTGATGIASAGWQLGTDAAEEQRLHVLVRTSSHQHEVVVRARAVPHIVSQLRLEADTPAVLRLGDTLEVRPTAIDPYGNVFPAPDVTRIIGGPLRGRSVVDITSGGVTIQLPLDVVQYVAAIEPVIDTIQLFSLGAEMPVAYVVRDDRGRVVADTAAALALADTTVASLAAERVRSLKNGVTSVRLSIDGVEAVVGIEVVQRIASLRLRRDTIRFDALLDTTTVYPIAHDSLGSNIPHPAVVVQVANTGVVELAGRLLQARTPGVTMVTVEDSVTGVATVAPVVVQQRITAIEVGARTFDALGDTQSVAALARDRLGSLVASASLEYSVSDTSIAVLDAENRLRSRREGTVVLSARDPATGVMATADVTVDQVVTALRAGVDALDFDALNDTVPLVLDARDRLGAVVSSAELSFASSDTSVATVSSAGVVRSRHNGSVALVIASADGPGDTVAVEVTQRVAAIALGQDSLIFASLNAEQVLAATPVDRLGSAVETAMLTFSQDDPALAEVDGSGRVRALANGVGAVFVLHGSDTARVGLRVEQRPYRVRLSADTIRFDAFGESATLTGVAEDSLGSAIVGGIPELALTAPAGVVERQDSGEVITARANGVTGVTLTVAGITGTAVVIVDQVAVSMNAAVTFGNPVITLPAGSTLPMSCQASDRNGFAIDRDAVVSSVKGTVTGTCDDARVERSGYDTLVVAMNGAQGRVPVIVATRPDSVGITFAAQPLPDDPRIRYVGEDLGDPSILALRPLVAEILAAYGNPTSSLGRARAIRDWVARTAIYATPIIPNNSTDNLSALPSGKTWADVNAVLSQEQWDRDRAFWADISGDGHAILDRLLGAIDPATGMRADDGMMVHIAGAHYRMRDIESYRFLLCTYQTVIVNTLWAAAGLRGMLLWTYAHDPATVFIPELGRWVYQDPSFNNDFINDEGDLLSPADLLELSRNGMAGSARPVRIAGPSYDPETFVQNQTYFRPFPQGFPFMGAMVFKYQGDPNPTAWTGRFVQIDVPELENYSPANDESQFPRVTPVQAFPTLGVVLQDVRTEDSVIVVRLGSNHPNPQRFERRVQGGEWETVPAENVLPVGACSVEFRSVDDLGTYSTSAIVDVWAPRTADFVLTGDPLGLRNQSRFCS